MTKEKKKILINVFIVFSGILLVKFSSLFRDMVLTYKFGASYITDAYIIAMTIPNVIFAGMLGSVGMGFIPIYNEIKMKEPQKENQFSSNIINCLLIISTVLCVLMFCFTKEIVSLLASGFDQKTFELAVNLTKPISLIILVLAISGILQSYLQAKNRFLIISFVAVPTNILIAIFIFMSTNNIANLGWKVLVSYLLYIPILYVAAFKAGFRYKLCLNLKESYLKKIVEIIIPLLIMQVVMDINVLIDKTLASNLESGVITALDYASKVNILVYGLIATAISTVFFPNIAQIIQNGEYKKASTVIKKVLVTLLCICIPLFVFMVISSERIVRILFYRGAFDIESVRITATALQVYLCATIAMNLRIILEKVYYSIKNTRSPLKYSIVSIAINILISIFLVRPLGYIGLAIGTSISVWISIFFYWKGLQGTLIEKFGKEKKEIFKYVIATAFMGIVCYLLSSKVFPIMEQSNEIWEIMNLIFIGVAGIIVYCIGLFVLKTKVKINCIEYFNKRG